MLREGSGGLFGLGILGRKREKMFPRMYQGKGSARNRDLAHVSLALFVDGSYKGKETHANVYKHPDWKFVSMKTFAEMSEANDPNVCPICEKKFWKFKSDINVRGKKAITPYKE